MTLQNLLTSIKNKDKVAKNLLRASTGKRFEEEIANKLREDMDYAVISKKDYQKYHGHERLKKEITGSSFKTRLTTEPGINNYFKLSGSRILVHQPHGANNYPDFLLIKDDQILPLEIKFSTTTGQKPTWNSGYPRSKAIYIFGSYGRADVTAFTGDDYLEQHERDAMISIMDYAESEMESRAAANPNYDKDNFSVYLRRMYNQKQNSLKHSKRDKFELDSIALSAANNF